MHRNILLIVTAVVGLLAVVAAGMFMYGASLEPLHSVQVHADYDAPASAVWATIADVERYPEWVPGVEGVEVLPRRDGDLSFRQASGFGDVTYVIGAQVPNEHLVMESLDDGAAASGTRTYALSQADGLTRVTLTEMGSTRSAMLRGVEAIFTRPDAGVRAYLEALAVRLGSRAKVELDTATR